MKENILEAQKRYESQIDSLKLNDSEKSKLKRVLKGIIESPRGRLFSQKSNSFEEYLTLRPTEDSMYEFCVIERMINEYSGATEASKKTPLSLTDFSRYVKEHESVLESEVVNSENYQKRLKMQEQVSTPKIEETKKTKTPQEEFKEMMIASIEKMQYVPEYKKQRAVDVLEAIAVLPQNRLYSKKENGYSEAIALRGMRYGIVRRMSDHAGATAGRDFDPLNAKGLLEYIENNRESIDKSIKEAKKLYPDLDKKPEEKETRKESQDDDGR